MWSFFLLSFFFGVSTFFFYYYHSIFFHVLLHFTRFSLISFLSTKALFNRIFVLSVVLFLLLFLFHFFCFTFAYNSNFSLFRVNKLNNFVYIVFDSLFFSFSSIFLLSFWKCFFLPSLKNREKIEWIFTCTFSISFWKSYPFGLVGKMKKA